MPFNRELLQNDTIATENLNEDLNRYITVIRKQIAEASITLLSDPQQLLDKIRKNPSEVIYVGIGTDHENVFTTALKNAGVQQIWFAPGSGEKELKRFRKKLKNESMVILGIHGLTGYPAHNFGLDDYKMQVIQEIEQSKKTFTVVFGNPYVLKNFNDQDGLLVAYDNADETQEIAAAIITGQLKPKGRLPVTASLRYKAGDGIRSLTNNLGEISDTVTYHKQYKNTGNVETHTIIRYPHDYLLQCCVSPNALGANTKELDQLDAYIESVIQSGAFPGCRILVAKEGKVFYDKPFGYLTPDKKTPVTLNTIYDLASVTKVAATTLAMMKLYDEGKWKLDDSLGQFLPITLGTDKAALRLRNILTHQAGLKAWIPFYKETLDNDGKPLSTIYSSTQKGNFSIPVTADLYMRKDWKDTIWKRILASPLEAPGHYVYSDLDFLFLQEVVESLTHQTLDVYVQHTFYEPLGLQQTAFVPSKNLPNTSIAPTENDQYFRHEVVDTYVHDMGAAMMGGVAGHAGLFTSANDLAILFQLLLNKGVYQGKRYLQATTVELFTARQSANSRRGLGFDKPELSAGKANPCADNVSSSTFGHQGFTGTCVWADPEHELVFIFLSNRTYPSSENKLINKLAVREKAQAMIYDALGIVSRYRH